MMSHPTIVTTNGKLRYNALLKEAETERRLQKGKSNKSVMQRVITAIQAIEVNPKPRPKAAVEAR